MRLGSVSLVLLQLAVVACVAHRIHGFTVVQTATTRSAKHHSALNRPGYTITSPSIEAKTTSSSYINRCSFSSSQHIDSTKISAVIQDMDVIASVGGQESYLLAVVALGEGLCSFAQAPHQANIKVLIPPVIAATVLAVVSGPMIASGDAASVGTGLWVATVVCLELGASYVLRLLAPSYDTYVSKDIAASGLIFAATGLLVFGQNLRVTGFIELLKITLPTILPMPPSENFV